MLVIYIVCAAIGLGLALLAAIGAGHGHDADTATDTDHGLDFFEWIPVVSLRFWTYALAGYGSMGVLLTLFTQVQPGTVTLSATVVGAIAGSAVWLLAKMIRRSEQSSGVVSADLLGKQADVLVTIRPGQPGKIRLEARGDLIDLVAVSDGNETIAVGEKAYVVSVDDGKALVMGSRVLLDSHDNPQQVRAD
jgi:membrane protein implicated in regulation of membrane protease activity